MYAVARQGCSYRTDSELGVRQSVAERVTRRDIKTVVVPVSDIYALLVTRRGGIVGKLVAIRHVAVGLRPGYRQFARRTARTGQHRCQGSAAVHTQLRHIYDSINAAHLVQRREVDRHAGVDHQYESCKMSGAEADVVQFSIFQPEAAGCIFQVVSLARLARYNIDTCVCFAGGKFVLRQCIACRVTVLGSHQFVHHARRRPPQLAAYGLQKSLFAAAPQPVVAVNPIVGKNIKTCLCQSFEHGYRVTYVHLTAATAAFDRVAGTGTVQR